jgi:TonB family protein
VPTKKILQTHVEEGEYRRPVFISIAGHLVLFLFFLFGVQLLPAPPPVVIGTGPGGGQGGDFVSVGLSAEIGGGAGMYKESVKPQAEVAPPPPPKPAQPEPAAPEKNVFLEKKSQAKKQPEASHERAPEKKVKPTEKKGLIPREPDPGKGGPSSGSGGTGGGFGSGRGVSIGSGTGEEGGIDSWYVRQVEQRIGRNWLETSLGKLKRVEATATFVVRANGQIENIQLEQRSGVSSVDRAVLRAIQASNPLPPLPYEFRGRSVRFQAVFEYPQR